MFTGFLHGPLKCSWDNERPGKTHFGSKGNVPDPRNSTDYMSDQDKQKPDLSGLIEQIKAADVNAFHDVLKTEAQDHYNKVFRTGYGVAKGEFEPKLKAGTESLKSLQDEIAAREAKIKELTENTPDLAKLEAGYELTLQQKAEEIERLKKQYNEELSKKDSMVLSERKDSFNANFVRSLVELGVDKDYAEVLVMKQSTQERVKWSEERQPRVYQDDGHTPFPQAEGKPAYSVLAADLLKSVPDKFINDRKPTSPGFGSLNGDLKSLAGLPKDQVEAQMAKMWGKRLG